MIDYTETELHCENQLVRKWIDSTDYVWFTDLDCSYLGETLEEALMSMMERKAS